MIQGLNPFTPKIIANSPYGLPYNSYHVSLENLVLLSTTNTVINILFIFITCLLDIFIDIVRRTFVFVTNKSKSVKSTVKD